MLMEKLRPLSHLGRCIFCYQCPENARITIPKQDVNQHKVLLKGINGDFLGEIISVTKEGQATVPKRLREKYGIKRMVLIEEYEKGILLKPLPSQT